MADSNLAEWLRSQAPADFLTGVVYGLDVVPRLSLGYILIYASIVLLLCVT